MKFICRQLVRGRLRWAAIVTASLLLITVIYNLYKTPSSPVCAFPNDDPVCNLLITRFTDLPETKKRIHLDVGAQWCADVVLDKPQFPHGFETQTWQDVRDRNVLVFSAFLDDRRRLGGPLIRIVASGLQEQFNHVGHLFCTLWYADIDLPVSVGPAIYDIIYPSLSHTDMWVAHFVLCPMPVLGGIGAPYAVSVTARSCESPSNALMLLNRLPVSTGQFSLAACFPPVYGKFVDWTLFVEWIELYRLLGMNTAFFYNYSMDGDVSRVMDMYREERSYYVDVVQWKFPSDKLTSYFGQRSAINDCLYRAGHTHKYVAVVDLDEVMTPRQHFNWSEMMQSLSRPKVGAYLFQHAYFRRNSTGEKPYLISQQSRWRTDVVTPPGKIRCKSMYVASRAIKADVHFPYALVEKFEEYVVPPEVAMLHHYRPEPMENFRKHPEQYRFIEDTHMDRYKKALKRIVLKRLDDLYMKARNATRHYSRQSRINKAQI